MYRSNLKRTFIKPYRIIDKCNVINENYLFTNNSTQVHLVENECCIFNGGYILLDFKKELCGGIRIICHKSFPGNAKIRVRFGESVGECMSDIGYKNSTNDHSIRDTIIEIASWSDVEYGKTGFRFVRIDFPKDYEIHIVNIYAISTTYPKRCIGSFKCDDSRINKIFDTAKYTCQLTMQDTLIEGVKRDRLIWVGDMYPQVVAISYLYGKCDLVEDAITQSINKNKMPSWIVSMPTYSCWLIAIVTDYYIFTNRKEFTMSCIDYIKDTIVLLNSCADNNGDFDFSKITTYNEFFVDWPLEKTKDVEQGGRYIFYYALNKAKLLFSKLNIKIPDELFELERKLDANKIKKANAKQVIALGYLNNKISAKEASEALSLNGANGLSTFMSYFILKSMSETINTTYSLEILKKYYGAMLDIGATTFFEDFDINWTVNSSKLDEIVPKGKNDIHGDFGDFCYKGFRHSLCHGWSCGPVQFIYEKIIGIKVIENGYKEIEIHPSLGNLKYAKCSVATSFGKLTIEHKVVDGKIITKVNCPKEIKYTIK